MEETKKFRNSWKEVGTKLWELRIEGVINKVVRNLEVIMKSWKDIEKFGYKYITYRNWRTLK